MNNKDYSISTIRLFSILLIITCHILQGFGSRWAYWVNVGVQIFFFMSGYLYSQKNIIDKSTFYKKRIKSVLFPYSILFLISLLLELFVLKNNYSIKMIFGCLIGLGGFIGNISILSHTWFVSYIMLCYLLTPILQDIFKGKNFKNNFLIFMLIVSFLQLFQKYGIINIDACWINNYIIGYYWGKCSKELKNQKKAAIMLFVSFMIVMPFAILYQEKVPFNFPELLNRNSLMIINYGHVLLGSVLFVMIYEFLNKIDIKENKLLLFSDNYSYYIYLVHQIFILNSFSVLFLSKYLFLNLILIIVLSIIFAIILKNMCDVLLKFFHFLLKRTSW